VLGQVLGEATDHTEGPSDEREREWAAGGSDEHDAASLIRKEERRMGRRAALGRDE
jgi:hypothetical protein